MPWPVGEDEIPYDAKDVIECFLQYNPTCRLGSYCLGGVSVVKAHPFFSTVIWETLEDIEPEFVPEFTGDDDTGYFDGNVMGRKCMTLYITYFDGNIHSTKLISQCRCELRNISKVI